jgi:hypothetical protein
MKCIKYFCLIICLMAIVHAGEPSRWCYQETATDNSSGCGISTGSYSSSGSDIYFNYGIPNRVIGGNWFTKYGISGDSVIINQNFSTQNCSLTPNGFLNLSVHSASSAGGGTYGSCYNGSSWNVITTIVSFGSWSTLNLGGPGQAYDGNWNTATMRYGGTWYAGLTSDLQTNIGDYAGSIELKIGDKSQSGPYTIGLGVPFASANTQLRITKCVTDGSYPAKLTLFDGSGFILDKKEFTINTQ